MAKGNRDNLERLLRSTWEFQRRQQFLSIPSQMPSTTKAERSVLRRFFANAFVQAVAVFVALAVALSGKLSVLGAGIALVLSWSIGSIGIWTHCSDTKKQKIIASVLVLAFGGLSLAFAIYLTHKMPKNEVAVPTPTPVKNPTDSKPEPIPTKLPDLKWRYDLEIYGDVKDPAGQKIFPSGHNIIIAGEISNVGEVASIARDWNLTVRMVGEETERQTNLIGPFPSKGKFVNGFVDAPHNVEMAFENYLPESTTTEPLIPGSNKPGFLIFGIKGVALNRLEAGGNTFTMGFGDVTGKVYKFDLVTPRAGQLTPHFAIPGMRFSPG